MSLTSFDGTPVRKPFSWSYSKLSAYRTCPKKYYHAQVVKDFPDYENDHMRWGKQVHDAMAKRITHSSPLPAGMEHWEHWAEWAINPTVKGTLVKCEQKMAITDTLQRCEYFDKKVPPWFRTVADVLKVRSNVARVIDWKTGAVKEGEDQVALSAATIMVWYPEVDYVLGQYVWLQHNVKQEEIFERRNLPLIWGRSLPYVQALQEATDSGDFPPKPSGLCKRHCDVMTCAYYKRGAY